MDTPARPPVTVEGWYALHQIFRLDRSALHALPERALRDTRIAAADALAAIAAPPDEGWSAIVRLVGSVDDLLLMHFRPTLDALGDVQKKLARVELLDVFRPTFSFLSVTEVGLYNLTDSDNADDSRIRAEREQAHTKHRLYPVIPATMPFVSFYPTSKRRDPEQNWYTLPLSTRSTLMHAHGATGRRHATHIRQIITGAIGFDCWEWGVTLFADDPLELKRVVTDMRYDEASAKYAEFGEFYVGRLSEPREWALSVGN